MDNFEKIIKQKVDQFEVPYNEAHWAEMEGRLNSIRFAKIRNTVLGTVGIIAVVAISGYFVLSNQDKDTTPKNDTNIVTNTNSIDINILQNNEPDAAKENSNPSNHITYKNNVSDQQISEENNEGVILINENDINTVEENKIVKEDNTNSNIIKTKIPTPDAEFIVYNNRICMGEDVSFEAVEKDLPVSYKWDFGDGTSSTKATPKHKYNDSGSFDVSLTLTDRQSGKSASSTQKNVVTILPKPQVEFTYNETSIKHDDNYLKYPYTTFSVDDADNSTTYKWIFGNGEKSSSANTRTIYDHADKYTVTLVAKNENGCVNINEREIEIKNKTKLIVENTFTPDENDKNETFIPLALLEWDVPFKMTIIDKSGRIVYQTTDKNEPWNGRMNNNGQLLNEGIYGWQVVIYDVEGLPHIHQGIINLARNN